MIQKKITDYYGNTKLKKQKKITNYFKKIIQPYNFKTNCWYCLICGDNMGENNPRQLCGKTHCYNLTLSSYYT